MHKLLLSAGLALAVVSLQAQTQPANGNRQNTNQSNSTQSNSITEGNHSQSQNTQSQNNENANTGHGATGENDAPGEKARVSHDVNVMLKDTNEARQALSSKNKQEAQQDVNDALRESARLQKADNGQKLLPLYTELDEYSVLGPIRAARAGHSPASTQNGAQTNSAANQANSSKSQPNHSGAASTTGNYQNDLAVRRASGEYTMVALDAKADREHLEAARQALDKGDLHAADQALAAVQNGVVMESVETDMPLLRARENLILARDAAKDHNYEEARAALAGASKSLARYEQEGGSHASDAKQVQDQINRYDRTIGQNHTGAESRIDAWWNQVTGWNTPPHALNR